jgi:predicted metal-dependent enzyme (double-stranded beta helix superfamily)
VFDTDTLIADCRAAVTEAEPRLAILELLRRTVADGESVAKALDPTEGGLDLLYVADDLTVLHVVWAPGMTLYPHDHRMWAAIGIYTGGEDNTFFRRSVTDQRGLEESGGKELRAGGALAMGADAIHRVTNPLPRLTGAIHVYGGNFVNEPRSQWGPGPIEERPYDIEQARQQFVDANERWRQQQ